GRSYEKAVCAAGHARLLQNLVRPDRGREDRLASVPPPSEPDVRISRIRLSSRWFTSSRTDRPERGPSQESTTHARQRTNLASANDRTRNHGPFACSASAECFEAASESTYPAVET